MLCYFQIQTLEHDALQMSFTIHKNVFDWIENNVEKMLLTNFLAFSPFPQCFLKPSPQCCKDSQTVWCNVLEQFLDNFMWLCTMEKGLDFLHPRIIIYIVTL